MNSKGPIKAAPTGGERSIGVGGNFTGNSSVFIGRDATGNAFGSGSTVQNRSINIGGDVYGQVGETLTNCTNMVNVQPPGEKKTLMERLQNEVTALINQLPEDKRSEAENIAENLEDVLKQSGKDKPSAGKFDIAAKGLLEAAEWVKDFSLKIGGTLLALGKLTHGAAYLLPTLYV
jgi:hypothetical protein